MSLVMLLGGKIAAGESASKPIGHPSFLKDDEKKELQRYCDTHREDSTPLDRETLITLARSIFDKMRPGVPGMSFHQYPHIGRGSG